MTDLAPSARTGPSRPSRAPGALGLVIALARYELALMMRRPGTIAVTLGLPLVFVGLSFLNGPPVGQRSWGTLLSMHIPIAVLLTVFMQSVTVLVTRRQTLVLKRLRSTELSAWQVLAGMALPPAVLSLLQVALLVGLDLLLGASPPVVPALVVAGVLLTVAQALVLAVAVAALTSTAEKTQITVIPVLLAAAIGAQIITGPFDAGLKTVVAYLPLVSCADLIAKGWGGPDLGLASLPRMPDVVTGDVVIALCWCLLAGWVVKKYWRWDPRG